MPLSPIAAADSFTGLQGQASTTLTGNLGADNGAGLDYDPDGTILGWVAGSGFSPVGDGDRYLGAFFTEGVLSFLHITGTVSYPFPVVMTATAITTAEGGRVVLDTSGGFTYQSALGFTGTDSFTYTLVDADFNQTTATVTLNVTASAGANDRPIAADDAFAVNEDTVLSGNLLTGSGADSDPDGDTLTVRAQTVFSEAGGLVRIFAAGTFTYTPKAGYHGPDGFDYTLLDPSGASDIGHVTLTVASVNDAPVARDDSFTLNHDRSLNGNVLAGGIGADTGQDGDALAVVAQVLTTAAGGLVTLNADGSFAYTPASGFVGQDGFDYTLRDPSGASDTGHVTLNVLNHAPDARTDHFSLGYRGQVTGNVLAANGQGPDSDADGDALGVTAGRFVTAKGSVFTVAADGRFTFTAGDLSFGLEFISYTLTDALGASTTGTAQFSVATPPSHMGNTLDESWLGSAAADIALMFGGDDTADGSSGLDVIGGGAGDDVILGGNGNDRLYGEADKDALSGGAGSDRLDGGAGQDRLKGGSGADHFVLTRLQTGPADRIADYAAGDKLVFQAAEFGLAAGPLADASWLVAKTAADGTHGRFVYDSKLRSLSWDDDGLAATAGQQLALFDNKVTLTLDSFLME